MIHVMAQIEDITIVATRGPERWEVKLSDNGPTGCYDQVMLTDNQFASMMFLVTGNDEGTPQYEAAYEVVEPIWKDVKVRPFP